MIRQKPNVERRRSAELWASRLPTHWSVCQIKNIAKVTLGRMLQSEDSGTDAEALYMRAANVQPDGALSLHGAKKMWFSPSEIDALNLRRGDVVVVEGGVGGYGRAAFVSEELSGWGFQNSINRVRPRADVEGRFVAYYLIAARQAGYIQAYCNIVSMPHFTAEKLAAMRMPLPSSGEQRTIADYLDRETAQIDALIRKQERLIETLRERRAASIQAYLSHVGGEETRLKRVATIQTGVTLGGEGDVADPEWPYLRVANVQTGYVDTQHVKVLRLPEVLASESLLHARDVLMTEGGDIDKLGRGSLWNGTIEPCLHQNHVFAVRANSMLEPGFLVYLLDSADARIYFRATAKKTTNLASTNKWTLGNLPLVLPTLDEQRRAVGRLDQQTAEIDLIIAKAQQFIELAKERRAALITAAVTGQIDVRERGEVA